VKKRGREEKAIEPIQHASMAWNQSPRILDLGTPLHHRLRKISELTQNRQADGKKDTRSRFQIWDEQPRKGESHDDRSDNSACQAFKGFIRTDLGIELVPSEEGAAEQGRDVPRPDRDDEKENPGFSVRHVSNERDIGEKKPDKKNSEESDPYLRDR